MASVYNTFLGIYSRKMKIYVPENYIEECSSFFICSIQKLGIPSNVQKSWSSLQRNVLCCAQSLQLHPSWGTLWTVAGQAPLSMGFSRQEYWSGLPCPPPGDLPNPGIKPRSLRSPALAGRPFTTSATGEAQQGNPTQQWKRRTADAYNNLDPVSVGHRDVLQMQKARHREAHSVSACAWSFKTGKRTLRWQSPDQWEGKGAKGMSTFLYFDRLWRTQLQVFVKKCQ